MKITRFAALATLFLYALPASAQWQTPNHSVPIGRGAGVTGFGSAAPATAGRPFISNGAATDPSFGLLTNGGITPGAANTLKGSLNGTTTVDIAVPACTSVGSALQWAAGTGPQCNPVSVFTGFDMPVNMGLAASATGNALTITLTTADGSVPSTASPVLVPFRSTTTTTGTATWRTITSTLTMTVPSGATLGASSSNVPFRLWLFLADNGGAPELAVAACSNTTAIFPCASWEATLKTSLLLDTSADSAGVLYAPTAVASDAVRIIGYCNFSAGLATAGTWASSCTLLQLMGPGVKKPGDVVQTVAPAFGSLTAVTFTTTPTTTNVTANITPTTAVNLVRYQASTTAAGNGANNQIAAQMYRGATALGATGFVFSISSGVAGVMSFVGLDAPGVTSSTAYAIKGGNAATVGTGSIPAVNTHSATEILEEIQGALPEPANDNMHPGVFSKAA